jgi:hypothetical protein
VPINPQASVEMEGVLSIPQSGEYGFALQGWNAVQLFIDGNLIVDNGGSHGMKRVENRVQLSAGDHIASIQFTAVDFPGWRLDWMPPGAFEWMMMDGREFSVPSGDYVPPSIALLTPDAQWGPAGWRTIEDAERVKSVAVLPSGEVVVGSEGRLTFLDETGVVLRTQDVDAGDIVDMVVTESGHLVLLDRDSIGLLILDANGNEVGRVSGQFASAGGLGVLGNRVYIASPSGGVIYAITLPDGAVQPLGISGAGVPNRAAQPSDVAARADGTLLLSDFEKSTVVVGTEAQPTDVWAGATGTGEQIPRILTLGEFVVLTEATSQRIIVLDSDGDQRGVYNFPRELPGPRPMGIALSADGRLYVIDLANGRLYRFIVELPDDP